MKVPLTPVRFLRYAQEQFPGKTAVVCDDRRFTYAQFGERAGRLAGALRSAGAKPGDRVAFLSTNCHRLLEAYYGVVEAGNVLLPLNIRLAPQELSYILNDAGAKFLFFESQFLPMVEAFRPAIPSVGKFFLLDGEPQARWLEPRNYENFIADAPIYQGDLMQVDEDAVIELFYTSGTSAEPKGVMLTNRTVYLHALYAGLATNVTGAGHVELHTIPLFHANGWGVAHTVTFAGGTHVMVHRFDPREVLRLIEQEHVTHSNMVPAMATAMVNFPERSKYDLSSLKRLVIGGAASSPTLVREVMEILGCDCVSGYGLTETCPVLSLSTMKDGLQWDRERRYAGQARTGFAIPGVELRVVDPDGKDVPRDGQAIGEIVARSDVVMEGYWKQPEATERAFEGGWFHTGDMATIDENSYILIVDRKKDIIVSGGENISSLEVEKVVLEHPSVYEVAVIPVPNEKWGEVPKALVVLKPGKEASETELLEFCRARLAHYKCPQSVEFYPALPKTGTGKMLKKELRKKYWPAMKAAPGTASR